MGRPAAAARRAYLGKVTCPDSAGNGSLPRTPEGVQMGFSPGLLDQVVDWATKYQIRPGAAVLDIGTSELFCSEDPASLNRFLAHFGAEP